MTWRMILPQPPTPRAWLFSWYGRERAREREGESERGGERERRLYVCVGGDVERE